MYISFSLTAHEEQILNNDGSIPCVIYTEPRENSTIRDVVIRRTTADTQKDNVGTI